MSSQLLARATTLRKKILSMVYSAQSGHIGGPFSLIDFLTVLYFGKDENEKPFLNYSNNPKDPNRDYVILSKAHCSAAMYAVFSEIGYIAEEELPSFRKIGSPLQGHVTNKIPGGEISGGSLGQGLSLANGICLGLKLQQKRNKVWCLLGDGELQEGQVWEAVMTANHYNLGNLRAVVDRNKIQIDGGTEDVMRLEDVAKKFIAFGWEVVEIREGNSIDSITKTLSHISHYNKEKPLAIILHTTKGKGVSFMEDTAAWHGKAPNEEEFAKAMEELNS